MGDEAIAPWWAARGVVLRGPWDSAKSSAILSGVNF